MESKIAVDVIMPMCGQGTRMEELGEFLPKPLIKLPKTGNPMLLKALSSLEENYSIKCLTIVVLQEHFELFQEWYAMIREKCEFLNVVVMNRSLSPVHTALAGVCEQNRDFPIIILDCDIYAQLPKIDCVVDEEYYVPSIDASVYLFCWKENNPHLSYVEQKDGVVTDIREKVVISEDAVFGAYCFNSRKEFMMHATVEDSYISDVVRRYIRCGKVVKCANITSKVENYGTKEEFFKNGK